MLSLAGFYIYRLVKFKVSNIQVTRFKKVVKQITKACPYIVLMFYGALGGPSWFLPLVR